MTVNGFTVADDLIYLSTSQWMHGVKRSGELGPLGLSAGLFFPGPGVASGSYGLWREHR